MNHPKCIRVLAALAAFVLLAVVSPAWGDENPVAVRATPQYPSVAQGGRLVVAVELDHKPGFHSWPEASVKLPESCADVLHTEIGCAQDASGKPIVPGWIARIDGVQYPETKLGKVPDPTGEKPTIQVPLYSENAIAYLRAEVKPDAPLGDQTLQVRVYTQSCNEQVCMPPQESVVSVTVRVVPSGTADLGASSSTMLFAKFDAKGWGSGGTGVPAVAPPAPVRPSANSTVAAGAGGATIFGMDIGTNIVVLALAAMLGGFVLNLTPCVLPVIPIKVMSLTQHATSRGHALVLGLWMAAGVVAFWAAIGLPMAIVSRHLDPSQYIFGIWWVCLSIGLIVALMGLGIMGLFSLNLPQSVYMIETKADSPMGSFVFGVLAAVLGLPCFGFMAGGLLAAASTMPASAIMTIFVGIGVGMAAPYLALSIWPQLLRFIPRTGPASELVKQVMGILLLAAAAFFVTAGIQVLHAEIPYLAGSMVWWSVGFFIAVASVWLIARTWQITRKPGRRAAFTLLACLMTGGIWWFAHDRLDSDRNNFLERTRAMAEANKGGSVGTGRMPAGVWLEYTPELLAAAKAAGHAVFLDFTASWCMTCKALKAAVLDREPLRSEFKNRGVVLMEVDCSARNGVGSTFLRELGRTGVPTWVVYGPGKDAQPVVVDISTPTSQTVLDTLDRVGVRAAAAPGADTPSASPR
jgi:thiol:disulfide interchange protein DsbD